uniref:Uncharacterized protein n=1 Tax=Megaselia scalaris TaxID=36166 RepID=T1GI80_MEGSC
ENLEKAHKDYEKRYNLRSRPIKFSQGQLVFKRNMILSDKNKNLNASYVQNLSDAKFAMSSAITAMKLKMRKENF